MNEKGKSLINTSRIGCFSFSVNPVDWMGVVSNEIMADSRFQETTTKGSQCVVVVVGAFGNLHHRLTFPQNGVLVADVNHSVADIIRHSSSRGSAVSAFACRDFLVPPFEVWMS